MRPQARPFMVEVKTRHGRGQNGKSASSQSPITAVANRERPNGHAFEAASRLFSGLVTGSPLRDASVGNSPSGALGPSTSGQPAQIDERAQPRRILPSLNTINQDLVQESAVGPVQPLRQAKRPTRSKKPAISPEQVVPASVLQAEPEQVTTPEAGRERPECPSAEVAPRVRRRRDVRVPLGERWKRRRLPEICW
jgi:hypothetical protein